MSGPVHLVPIAIEHAAAVQALASDPLIAETSNVPHPYPPDGALTWIRYTTARRELGREMNFAIVEDGEVIGVCGVLGMSDALATGEVGYWIGVPYWGKGRATAAVRQLLQIAFAERGMEKLRSSCLVRNRASYRVLEKAGFRLLGYGVHPSPKWSQADRFALFELTRDEWLHAASTMPHDHRTA